MSENLRETYVRAFQKCMDQDLDVPYEPKTLYLRMALLREEFNELQDEVEKSIFEFKENKSNMSKLEDGKPLLSEWGKVLKGSNYKPPNLEDLV